MAETAVPEQMEEAPAETSEKVVEEATEEIVEEATEEAPVEDFNSFDAFTRLRSNIKDEKLRKNIERFQSFDDMAVSIQEARQAISKAIKPINEDSKPSEITAFRKALGVPESTDDYRIPIPEGMSEEDFQSEDMRKALQSYADVALKHNVSADAFEALLETYFNEVNINQQMAIEADNKFAEQGEKALKDLWGAQYNTELELSNRGMEFAFSNDLEAIKELKVGDRLLADHPVFIQAMNKIGRAVSEDSVSSFPVDATVAQGLRAQLEKLTQEQADAQMRGEYQKAQALDLEIMEVSRKISGDGPIAGSGSMY